MGESVGGTAAQTDHHGAAEAKHDEASDPNRLICKREKAVGSRLASKKVCATAAQWAQMRADDRQAVERAQAQRTKSN